MSRTSQWPIPRASALTPDLERLATEYVEAQDNHHEAQAAKARLARGRHNSPGPADLEADAADTQAVIDGRKPTAVARLAKDREAADRQLKVTAELARRTEATFHAALRDHADELADMTLSHADTAAERYRQAIQALQQARSDYNAAVDEYHWAVTRRANYRHRGHVNVPDAVRQGRGQLEHPTSVGCPPLRDRDLFAMLKHDADRHNPDPTIRVGSHVVEPAA